MYTKLAYEQITVKIRHRSHLLRWGLCRLPDEASRTRSLLNAGKTSVVLGGGRFLVPVSREWYEQTERMQVS